LEGKGKRSSAKPKVSIGILCLNKVWRLPLKLDKQRGKREEIPDEGKKGYASSGTKEHGTVNVCLQGRKKKE